MTAITKRLTNSLITVIIAGTAVAGPTMLLGATAKAPEPANLGAPLGATTGATAEARYVYSGTRTTVIEWPSSYTAGPGIAPGTPCSTSALPYGAIATQVIVALAPGSNLRKCASPDVPVTTSPPVRLAAPLSNIPGVPAAAVYVNSGAPTTVVEWFSSYTGGPGIAPGTPCTTYALAVGEITTRVIVAPTPSSNLRKCQ